MKPSHKSPSDQTETPLLPSSLSGLLSTGNISQYPCGEPNQKIFRTLQATTVANLFPGHVRSVSHAQGALSGLWMLHGFLDQGHEICQSIATSEGSFWHAIMHRLEGDFWNSKYWYRQIGRHSVIEQIQAKLGTKWTPVNFVDQCERLRDAPSGSPTRAAVEQEARIEWQALFAYCWEQASGEGSLPFLDASSSNPEGKY